MNKDQIDENVKMKSKQMPLAYSFNAETPSQLVDIMTEQGTRLFCCLSIKTIINRSVFTNGYWSSSNGEYTFCNFDTSSTPNTI